MQTILESSLCEIDGIRLPSFQLDNRASLVIRWPCFCDSPAIKKFKSRLVNKGAGVHLIGADAGIVDVASIMKMQDSLVSDLDLESKTGLDAVRYLNEIGRGVSSPYGGGLTEQMMLRMLFVDQGSIGLVSTEGLDPQGRGDVIALCKSRNHQAVGWLIFEFPVVDGGDDPVDLPTVRARYTPMFHNTANPKPSKAARRAGMSGNVSVHLP